MENNLEKELEELRKRAVKRLIIAIIVAIAISAGLIFLFYYVNPNMLRFSIFILILSVIIAIVISNKPIKEFKDYYKRNIVGSSFTKIFTDINYRPDEGLKREVIANTNMMYMGDVYNSSDYLSAKYKNINFESADVEIQERHTDSEGHTHYTTIFSGQWFIFDFNKTFKADIQVVDKHFGNAKRGGLFSKKKFNKIELEDMEFNKLFKIYSERDEDAFYILTPNCMQKIKTLRNNTKGKMLLCFIQNKLHVGLYNGLDLFEPKLFRKVNLLREQENVLKEIKIITDFVDTLNLDNDLFRGEV